MTRITRWFRYGQPIDDSRVEAEIITEKQGGPNQEDDTDVEVGSVGYAALEFMDEDAEIQEHIHDDGSVLLSALSVDAEQRLLETFETANERRVNDVLLGLLSPRERELYQLPDTADAADELDVSRGTIRGMRQRIREKEREARTIVRETE